MFPYKCGIMRIVNDQDNYSKMVIYFKLVTESFRDFCKSEMLTDENLYDAGSIHGLQVFFYQTKSFILCFKTI